MQGILTTVDLSKTSYLFRSLPLWKIVSVQRSLLKRLTFKALRLWSFNEPFTINRLYIQTVLTFSAFRSQNV